MRNRFTALLIVILVHCLLAPGEASALAGRLQVDGSEFVLRLDDGRILRRDDLLGLTLRLSSQGADGVELRVIGTDADETVSGKVALYRLASVGSDDGPPVDLCNADIRGRRLGFPLPDEAGGFQFVCTSGADGKCVLMGYRPWDTVRTYRCVTCIAPACTCCAPIMAATIGRDAQWHRVDVSDRFGIQTPAMSPGLEFEAAWDPDGAVCVAHPRIRANITLGDRRHASDLSQAGSARLLCTEDAMRAIARAYCSIAPSAPSELTDTQRRRKMLAAGTISPTEAFVNPGRHAMYGISIFDLSWLAVSMLAAGAVTGLLAGVFGVGGGAVAVPILYEFSAWSACPKKCACRFASARRLPSSSRHRSARSRRIGPKARWICRSCASGRCPSSSASSWGASSPAMRPADLFKTVFVLVAGMSAIRLLFGKDTWRFGLDMPARPIMIVYGWVIGVLSALMGIGGGQLSNLFMTFYNRSIHQAVATSSGLGILISIPGALGYIYAGLPRAAQYPDVVALQFPMAIGYISLLGLRAVRAHQRMDGAHRRAPGPSPVASAGLKSPSVYSW